MFRALRNRFRPGENKNLDVLESLYAHTSAFLRDDGPENTFKTSAGLQQGGNESPTLYNLYMDTCMRVFENAAANEGIEFSWTIPEEATHPDDESEGKTHILWFGYADDLCILAKSDKELSRLLTLLDETLKSFGLKPNYKKTKTQILGFLQTKERPYPCKKNSKDENEELVWGISSVCSMAGRMLENVQHFQYLGSWISWDSPYLSEREIQ